jgi:hypothetical protein
LESEVDENPYSSVAVTWTTARVAVFGMSVRDAAHEPFPESLKVVVIVDGDCRFCGSVYVIFAVTFLMGLSSVIGT